MKLRQEAKKRVFDIIKESGINYDKRDTMLIDTVCDMMADALARSARDRALDAINEDNFETADYYLNVTMVINHW